MADVATVNLGEELKDSFKPVNKWVENGISWLGDIETFYRERAVIEKEYAGKIKQLSNRFYEKKNKKSASLSVGDTPQLTPGSLESASLTTWTTILTTTEAIAKEHDDLANALNVQVADVLKSLGMRYDDFRKRHEGLATKLEGERDGVYADLKKSKGKYDAECKEIEEKRVKADKSMDASKSKAQRAFAAEQAEMHNIKNSYLLQIAVANRQKTRYYHEELPEIVNSMQDLNESRVGKLNNLWTLSATLESTCHSNCLNSLSTQISEISRNHPALDSSMFVEHNRGGWAEPAEFAFEPSPLWHDNSDMVIDESSKTFLRNLLGKARVSLNTLKPDVERRRKEVAQMASKRDAVKADESQAAAEVDITKALLYYWEELLPPSTKLLTLEVETSTIMDIAGDLERGAQRHNFKSQSFKIPTGCDFCKDRIWGISAKGFTCQDCGYACHTKCELKIPADCPGVLDKAAKKALKEEREKEKRTSIAPGANGSEHDLSTLSRSNTTASSSSYSLGGGGVGGPMRSASTLVKTPSQTSVPPSTTSRPRVIAPPPDKYKAQPPLPDAEPGLKQGVMKYPFTATNAGDVTVSADESITILQDEENGSGWLFIRSSSGEEGNVPKSYVEETEATPEPSIPRRDSVASVLSKKAKPKPPPPRKKGASLGGNEVVGVMVYDYDAAGEGEVDAMNGEEIVRVLEEDNGGWLGVRLKSGGEGLVPTSYVKMY